MFRSRLKPMAQPHTVPFRNVIIGNAAPTELCVAPVAPTLQFLSVSMFVIRMIQAVVARFIALLIPYVGLRAYFDLWQRAGFHITRSHYYEPIPDTRTLKASLWTIPSDLPGIAINEPVQFQLLDVIRSNYAEEYDHFPTGDPSQPHIFSYANRYFNCVDPEILYGLVRHYKPQRIIEVGSGHSTYVSAQAVVRNQQENPADDCELVSIEPFPNETLRAGFPGLSRLMVEPVQNVPISEFEALQEDDILFIDSSHVVRIGSDVQYEILEIVPRIRKGVLVHFHDIFLPSEYPQPWVMEQHRFWTEQYMLQAFLAFNDRFEIIWAGNYMHQKWPDRLMSAFASYRRRQHDRTWVGPGSFWIRRT